jgi:hypothetical protein
VARRAGAAGLLLVRADSAYYGYDIVNTCRRAGARFSVTARLTPPCRWRGCPWRIGQVVAAALVVLHHEHRRTT